MAKRRSLNGKPLLVATAGVMLAVGCSGGGGVGPIATGNLMPPPTIKGKVCVDKSPDTATVQVNGMIANERCLEIEAFGEVEIAVSAPGYADVIQRHPMGELIEVKIELAAALEPPIDRPVGNLMPPPDRIDLEMPKEKPPK